MFFRPGTTQNHLRHALYFIDFCHLPSIPTVCDYITHLTTRFSSSTSIRNYISGLRMLHTSLDLIPKALDLFPVKALLRAVNLTMRTLPVKRLPILPQLLTTLCTLTFTLGLLVQPMKVCLTLGWFFMLKATWHLTHMPHLTLHGILAMGMWSSALRAFF